jgi:flagellar biosynthesis protein FlhF
MKMQKYYAPNITQALEEIQRELGPDALIVSVRQVNDKFPWNLGKKPGVEVIAMGSVNIKRETSREEAPIKTTNQSDTKGTHPPEPRPSYDPQAGNIKNLFGGTSLSPHSNGQKPSKKVEEKQNIEKGSESKNDKKHPLLKIQQRMKEQGIDEPIIKKLISSSASSLNPHNWQSAETIERFIQYQIEAHLRFSRLNGDDKRKWIFFVGMSGCGKTSTLLKVAAQLSQSSKDNISWVCANTFKASSISEAKIYTGNLGIPLYLVYTPEDLSNLSNAIEDTDWILVDTPACNPYSTQSVLAMGALLSKIPQRKTILVASATSKYTDLNQLFKSISPFGVDGLILTKMDETLFFGDIFNFAWYSHLPLIYYSFGPEIIDDFQPANPEFLTRKVLHH